jgi:hypothetical protein
MFLISRQLSLADTGERLQTAQLAKRTNCLLPALLFSPQPPPLNLPTFGNQRSRITSPKTI